MNAFLRWLMVTALLLTPAFGETNASTAQNPPDNQMSGMSIVEPPIQETLPIEKAEESASSYSMFRAVGGLGLVMFLMLAAYFAVKKLAPRFFAEVKLVHQFFVEAIDLHNQGICGLGILLADLRGNIRR